MEYTRPEVAVLGQAVHVIEQNTQLKGMSQTFDAAHLTVNPAYDLDE